MNLNNYMRAEAPAELDWDNLLRDADTGFRNLADPNENYRRLLQCHEALSEQLEWERDRYLDLFAREAHRKSSGVLPEGHAGFLERALQQANYRDQCRARDQWHARIEEQLDRLLVNAMSG